MKNIAIIVSIFALSIGLTSCGKAGAESEVKCYGKELKLYNRQTNQWEPMSYVMECHMGSAVCYYNGVSLLDCVED